MDFAELSAIFSSDFLDMLKFYLLTAVAAAFIVSVVWFAWITTGTAPLDYYVWLVQLTQSPGRRIVQVFTTNNTRAVGHADEPDASYHAEDHLAGEEEPAEATIDPPTAGANDDGAEQTTVVIIQTPYSASRLSSDTGRDEMVSSDNSSGRGPIRGVQPTDSTLINDLTRAFLFEFSTTVGESSARASVGEPVGGSGNQLNANEMDDIDAIYRVLRTNTDRDVARAATIALYSRSYLTRATMSGSSNPTVAGNTAASRQTNVAQSGNGEPTTAASIGPTVETTSRISDGGEPTASVTNSGSGDVNASQSDSSRLVNGADNVFISYDSLQIMSSDELFPQTATFAVESTATSSSASGSSSLGSSFDSLWSTSGRSRQASVAGNAIETASVVASDAPSTSAGVQRPRVDERSWENASTTIRLKFLDDTQRIVKTWLETSVGDFKRRYFAESLESGKVVRLIFQGQLLRDDSRSLGSYGIHDQCAVHCHVGTKPYQQQTSATADDRTPQAAGDRRTASNGGTSTHRESVQRRNGLAMFGSWLLAAGVSRLELLFFMLWSGLTMIWLWSQPDVDENNNAIRPSVNRPLTLWQRGVLRLRAAVHLLLRCLFDPALFTRTQRRWIGRPGISPNLADDDDHHFNFGSILGLLVAVKLSTIWLLVVYYPSVADLRSIILLMLTSFTALLFIACHNSSSNGGSSNGAGGGHRFNAADLFADRQARWPAQ